MPAGKLFLSCVCHSLLHVLPVRLEVRIQSLFHLIEIRSDDLMDLGWENRIRFVQQRDDVST